MQQWKQVWTKTKSWELMESLFYNHYYDWYDNGNISLKTYTFGKKISKKSTIEKIRTKGNCNNVSLLIGKRQPKLISFNSDESQGIKRTVNKGQSL